ncbi:VTT domain-containing protein [Lentzea sp. NPDC004782]|uniref:TVP38/TMEM64 family protein n=1 Tax=Lentzea sp. NPDC004782 TaxID=3154458 RepID=UPI0033ABCF59
MRRAGLIVLVLLVVTLAAAAQLVDLPDVEALRRLGPVVFTGVCALGTAVFFPKPVLATAAGLLFGVTWGSVVAIAGFTAGAMIAFGIARLLGRDEVAARLGERLGTLEEVFARRGVEATLVIRLLPVLPFTLANYGAGVTSVKAAHFTLGTALGLVPSTVLAAVLGDAFSDLGSPRSIVALSVWAVLAAAGLWWGRVLVRTSRQT